MAQSSEEKKKQNNKQIKEEGKNPWKQYVSRDWDEDILGSKELKTRTQEKLPSSTYSSIIHNSQKVKAT